MKHKIIFILITILIWDKTYSQKTCPPFVIPMIGYTTQSYFGSGVIGQANFIFSQKDCNCDASLGGLCYLKGALGGIKAQYFHSKKAFDLSGSIGYHDWNVLPFAKFQMGGGFTSVDKSLTGKNFFHVDPAIGLDILIFDLTFGYTFYTEAVNNNNGSLFLQFSLTPLIFSKKGKPNKVFSTFSNSNKHDRETFMKVK